MQNQPPGGPHHPQPPYGQPQYPQQPHGYPPPGYPPPGYAQPPPQVHQGARSARSYGFASILCGLLAPIALIKGLSASKEIKKYPGAYTNAIDATLGTWLGGIITGLMVIGIIVSGGNASRGGAGSGGGTQPYSGGGSSEAAAALPFVAKVQNNCAKYKAGKNEIQKSAVFAENEKLLEELHLTDVKGVLKKLSTNQGGSELSLHIDVGDVEFATESLFAPINKGSDVYKAAAEMSEGQCVVFSASSLRASSITEEAKVCDTEYFAKFTSLKPCK
jgi:hypothetical protein